MISLPFSHQLVQDAAHRDDVVVGVGREADDPLVPRAACDRPRILAPRALNTSPLSAPGEPYRATSDDSRCSA